MKRSLTALAVMLALLFSLLPAAAAAEPEVPLGYTPIRTQADLELVRQNPSGKFLLMNDIVLTGTFAPLAAQETAPFTGVFDGAVHTLSGLKLEMTGSSTKVVGLFCYNAGLIRNLRLENVDIQLTLTVTEEGHRGVVGAVAGENTGSITSCFVSGTVQASTAWHAPDVTESRLTVSNHVGAVTGENEGTVTGCTADANVYGMTPMVLLPENGISFIGGIAGKNSGDILYSTNLHNIGTAGEGTILGGGIAGISDGTIGNCLSNMDAPYVEVAGIVGENTGSVTRCVNAGYAWSGCGIAETNNGVLMRCYYNDTAQSGVSNGDDTAVGLSAAQLAQKGSFSGLDFDTVWQLEAGAAHPTLRPFTLAVTELTLVSGPDKENYFVGETFDPAGLVVHAVYNNGDVEAVQHYSVQGFDTSTVGTKTVVLSLAGKEVRFPITVTAAPVVPEEETPPTGQKTEQTAPPTGDPNLTAGLCVLAGLSLAVFLKAKGKRNVK